MELQKRHIFNKGEILVFTEGYYSDYQIQFIYKVLKNNVDASKFLSCVDLALAEFNGLIKELNFVEINGMRDKDLSIVNNTTQNNYQTLMKQYSKEKNEIQEDINWFKAKCKEIERILALPDNTYIDTETYDTPCSISTVKEMRMKLIDKKKQSY